MKNAIVRNCAAVAAVILGFLALSYGFVPQVLEGKVLDQADIASWEGMSHEVARHNAAHPDDKTLWTDAMFGGMPTVGMYDDFEGDATLPVYKALLTGKRPASYFFVSLLGAFLLLMAFGTDALVAAGGAVAVTFCAYNLQIVQVGHNAKMAALAFLPWVLAAVVFTFRSALGEIRKGRPWFPSTLLGAGLFALALSFQIKANHVQITWYLALIILVYGLTMLVWVLLRRRKLLPRFLCACGLLLALGGVGVATNTNKLLPTYNYAAYTMRGGSELSSPDGSPARKGLDLDYATQWSYGIDEMPNLLIPNFKGGASQPLEKSGETYRTLRRMGSGDYIVYFTQYWGPQPGTAGPMYLGAVSLFLFVLGLLVIRGRERWWVVIASILAVFLAWGNHFMAWTRLWFDFAPMYNKFRSVSMALTVLQFTVPVLGFLALDRILKEKDGNFRKKLVWALGITGGFCLLSLLVPSVAGSFLLPGEEQYPKELCQALVADRTALLRGDALRSLLYIVAAFLPLFFLKPEGKWRRVAVGAVCLLVLADQFSVGRRFLNASHFKAPKEYRSQFAPRPVDKLILEDATPGFRVLDLSVNTFNDAHSCYWHKCIGGYSPVKFQRYQELIERYLAREIRQVQDLRKDAATVSGMQATLPYLPVTSMLNGKYIILQGNAAPLCNDNAFGAAWTVDEIVPANSPDEELALLGRTDLRRAAVLHTDFIPSLNPAAAVETAPKTLGNESARPVEKEACAVTMTSYAPNELHYRYVLDAPKLVVFSEIYHPIGWHATLVPEDGESVEAPIGRANWVLRAMRLPEGRGEVIMRYDPQDYRQGAAVSRASSWLLIVLVLLCAGGMVYAGRAGKKE